jgi:hypothetical protein
LHLGCHLGCSRIWERITALSSKLVGSAVGCLGCVVAAVLCCQVVRTSVQRKALDVIFAVSLLLCVGSRDATTARRCDCCKVWHWAGLVPSYVPEADPWQQLQPAMCVTGRQCHIFVCATQYALYCSGGGTISVCSLLMLVLPQACGRDGPICVCIGRQQPHSVCAPCTLSVLHSGDQSGVQSVDACPRRCRHGGLFAQGHNASMRGGGSPLWHCCAWAVPTVVGPKKRSLEVQLLLFPPSFMVLSCEEFSGTHWRSISTLCCGASGWHRACCLPC